MKDRKGEMLNLRITKRLKNWLLYLSADKRISMGQWVQKSIIEAIYKAIQDNAEKKAVRQAAKEIGVPEIIAQKLDTQKEALSLITADDHKEFTANVNKLYPVYLKNEMKDAEFNGLHEELEQINKLRAS